MVIGQVVLAGKHFIKSMRVAVKFVLELLTNGWTVKKISMNHSQMRRGVTAARNMQSRFLERGSTITMTKLLERPSTEFTYLDLEFLGKMQ
jgi:hypothetical protein